MHGSFDAAGLGLLGLRLFVPCADTGLHPAVKAQQAGNVVGGAAGQGCAAVALALGVAELDRGRPFARLVHIDLVGAVGVVFVVARCIVSIAPAVLERAAPGFAIVHAGLARAHPDLALPVAVAVAVPPVVVLLGEHGQAGEGLDLLGRHGGLQALVKGVPRTVLAHGLAHIVQHSAPGVFAGLPGVGVVAGLGGGRQHLPVARLALRVAAVQQRALGDRGGRVAPQLGGHALQPVARRGHLLHRQVEVPGLPDGDEHVVVARVALVVHMPLAERKIGLLEPAVGLVLLVRNHRRAHHGQDVVDADGIAGAQVVGHGLVGVNVGAAAHRAVARPHGGKHLVAVDHGGQAVFASIHALVELGGEHGAHDLGRELRMVGHTAHLVQQKLHLFGACDVHVVFVGEQRHPGLQPPAHTQLAMVVVAPQQLVHLQRAQHAHQLPAHHRVVQMRVAGDDKVGGAIGVRAGQSAVDAQVSVHEDQEGCPGHRGITRGVWNVMQPLAQRATWGQGGVEVQRRPVRVARDPQGGFVRQGVGFFRQAPGDPAVGRQAVGHFGQRAKSDSGHGAGRGRGRRRARKGLNRRASYTAPCNDPALRRQ